MNSEPRLFRWLVCLLAVVLVGYVAVYQCFTERVVFFDEVGLFNPVYMYLHYGKMTYPAHGQFDAMFVHPPTQYFFIAMLMRLGLSVYHAAGLLSVLLFAVYAGLVVSSRFSFPTQAGFLLGGYLGMFIWNEALVLRPDLTLTLAWAGGLVALETARLDNWNKRRLAIGGFLLALATGVHYPGVAACGGLIVCAVWIWRSLDRKRARIGIIWMFAGAALFAIPYAVFFLLPYARDVVLFAISVQREAPPGSAFQHQMESYAYWKQIIPEGLRLRPVTTLLTEPLFRWSLPAAFIAPPLLLILPSTRLLALAALPHLLFILFGARHKQINFTGYFAPEITVYLVAVFCLALTALFAVVRRLRATWPAAVTAAAVILAATAISATEIPALVVRRVVVTPGLYDFEVGRAAARSILGRDAVVGTASAGVWYTGGATHLYFISGDIIYPEDTHCIDLAKYFGAFDALAVDPHRSWIADNSQRKNITSSYVDGILQLKGFFFADRRDYYESYLSYMLYSLTKPKPFVGYGVRGQDVFRFQEQPGGSQVFVSAVCPTKYAERYGALDNTDLKLDFYAVLYRPISTNEDPREAKDHNLPSAIITLIAERRKFETAIRPALEGCSVRDEMNGEFTRLDLRSFIRNSQKDDQTIRFYRNYEAFRSLVGTLPQHRDLLDRGGIPVSCDSAAAGGTVAPLTSPPPGFTFNIPGALRLESIALAYNKASIQRTSPLTITTAPEQWAYAASIPIVVDRIPGSKRLLHIRGRVVKGRIGIGILNQKINAFEVERFADPTPGLVDFYIPIPAPEAADSLIIRNTAATGTVSQMIVEETGIMAPLQRTDPCARLEEITPASDKASIRRGPAITISAPPEQRTYAAAIPIHSPSITRGLVLKIRARVLSGEIGFGLLSGDRKTLVVEQHDPKSDKFIEVFLPFPASGTVSNLVIRNTSAEKRISMVTIERLETWKLD